MVLSPVLPPCGFWSIVEKAKLISWPSIVRCNWTRVGLWPWNPVKGHLGSFTPFNKVHTTLHLYSVVTLTLACTVSEIRHGIVANLQFSLTTPLFSVAHTGVHLIRRLQAKSKISSEYVFELQYADDAALPSHTADGLQRNFDRICEAYRRAGLVVNVKKTKVLPQASQQHISALPPFIVNNASLCTVQQFTYLGTWQYPISWL